MRTADNYLQIHAGKRTYMLHETMSQFESRLDPEKFVRIHRTTLVNLDRARLAAALERRPKRSSSTTAPSSP